MTPLSEKLHPSGFTSMSGKMSAILGFVFGEVWTNPHITELDVTADGFLLARRSDDFFHNSFIGALGDWKQNLRKLFEVAEVTVSEQQEFNLLWDSKVKDWRTA